MPTASLSNINVVGGQTKPEIQDQDVSPFAELEKQIRDGKIEPSKSIDSVLEEAGKAKGSQAIPGTKKENISSTESSEDVLDLYKRSSSEIEKIRASGRTLIPN